MRLLSISILLFFSSILNAQEKTSHFEALKNGDSKKMASYFGQNIDLSLSESKGIYSKKQAELLLNKFFEQNEPLSYAVKHEGGSKKRSQFEIGELKCSNTNFRTYILYNWVENSPQIIELRIELEE